MSEGGRYRSDRGGRDQHYQEEGMSGRGRRTYQQEGRGQQYHRGRGRGSYNTGYTSYQPQAQPQTHEPEQRETVDKATADLAWASIGSVGQKQHTEAPQWTETVSRGPRMQQPAPQQQQQVQPIVQPQALAAAGAVAGEKRVMLNIGGHLFETYASVLAQFPDSLLGSIFSGKLNMRPDEYGHYFFDKDPCAFEPILDFYRSRKYFERPGVSERRVREVAEYFQMEDEMFPRAETKVSYRKVFTKHLNLSNEAVFYLRSNERLEIVKVDGTGKLQYDCFPGDTSLPTLEHAHIVTRIAGNADNEETRKGGMEYVVEGKYIFYVDNVPDKYDIPDDKHEMNVDFRITYEFGKSEEVLG